MSYKTYLKSDFYLNLLARFLAWFVKRNPVGLINKNFNQRHPYWSAAIAAVTIISLILSTVWFGFLRQPKQVEAAWWNDSWQYRMAIPVSNTTGADLTDFQVKILQGANLSQYIQDGKIREDLGDLRFTDINGNVLPYWIEDPTATTEVYAWVRAPLVPNGGGTIYMYYGNPSATSAANGSNVFPFFDEFNAPLDTTKWTATGAYSISGGAMTITTGSVYTNNTILPTAQNYVYEYKAKWVVSSASYAGLGIADVQATQGSNNGSNKVVYFMTDLGNLNVGAWAATGGSASYDIVNGTTQYTAEADTYYVDGFSIDPTYVRYYHDRTQTNPYSGTWTSAPYLWLGYFAGKDSGTADIRDMTVDWVFARKYASADIAGGEGGEEVARGPIAYWSFDEGQGTLAHDGTSNKNNGTLTNMSATASPTSGWQTEDNCVAGKCLAFDGSNDYVTITDTATISSSVQTFSLWFKTNTLSDDKTLIGNNNNQSYNLQALVRLESSKINYYTLNSNVSTNKVFSTGTWYYLVIVADSVADTVTFYVDGVLDSTNNLDDVVSSTDAYPYSIGAWSTNNSTYIQFWDGRIDEPKIYNYARSAAQIKMDYNVGLAGMSGASAGAAVAIGKKSNAWMTNGLVGYWKMDEAIGTWNGTTGEVQDWSGNNNNGTAAGTTGGTATTTAGKFGNAGSFDGVDDKVTTGKPLSTFMSASDGTITAWAKLTSTPDGYCGTGNPAAIVTDGGAGYIAMGADSANWCGFGSDGLNKPVNGPTPTLNVWTHLVWTHTGGNEYFYVNGALTDSRALGDISNLTYNIQFGASYTGAAYFPGVIDEVRMYNRALSSKEVSDLYNWAPGPVAYWKMDERQGQAVNDSSGFGNNGTLGTDSDAASNDPTWTNGKYGAALKFDVVDDLVRVSNAASLDPLNVTVSAWVYAKASGGYIVLKDKATGESYALDNGVHNGGNFEFCAYNGASYDCAGFSNAPYLNQWVFLTGRYDGTNLTVWLNGKLMGTQATASLNYTSPNPLYIGGYIYGNQSIDGSIDDVKIYNYARSQKQIMEDMAGSAPNGAAVEKAVSATGKTTVGYWKFDEGYGTTANNAGSGGSALNGTLVNTPAWSNDGKFGKAINFIRNNGSYVSLASNPLSSMAESSASMWVKLVDLDSGTGGSSQTFLNLYTDANNGLRVAQDEAAPGRIAISYNSGGTTYGRQTDAGKITAGSWYHVAYTFNGSALKIYINAVPLDTAANTWSIGTVNWIGAKESGNGAVNGLLDEVKVYSYALTADEVKLDYNQGSAMKLGSFSQSSTGVASSSAASIYCVPGSTDPCSPPVAEWKFEEGSGQYAQDTSGNGNIGTLGWDSSAGSDDPTYAAGKFGKALKLDGAGDYVHIASAGALVMPYTTSLWFYPTKVSGYQGLMAYNTSGSPIIYLTDGSIEIDAYSAGTFRAWCNKNFTANDLNKWWHLEFVMNSSTDASQWQCYLNGVNVGVSDPDSSGTYKQPTSEWVIGAHYNNSWFFQGKIDDVKVYNYARTASQVAWEYNQGKPVGWWKFDECQGGVAHDSSGNGNNGLIYPGTGGTQTATGTCAVAGTMWGAGATGKRNASLNFDGTDDYVSVPQNGKFNLSATGFSIAAWILDNTNLVSSYNRIISWYDGSKNIQLGLYGRQYYINNTSVATDYPPSTDTVGNGWNYIVATFDGSAYVMYVNGKVSSAANNAKPFVYTGDTTTLYIGQRGGGNTYMTGQVDDVQIYNYALTPLQVKNLYNGGAVRFGQ